MAEEINVDTANLREAAGHHQAAAEHLRAVPGTHADIETTLDSLGPIFSELRTVGRELLEQRRRCYEQQADDHAAMATNLNTSADLWTQNEEDAVQHFRGLTGE